MREIKFRGRNGNMWLYGNLHIRKHEKYGYSAFIIGCTEKPATMQVDVQTVGQFTGLHDKNGKDIYEGDIVHLDAWKPDAMQIAFIEGAFCLADENGHFLGDIYYIHHAEVEQCTILGNIHDNPELLKGGEV